QISEISLSNGIITFPKTVLAGSRTNLTLGGTFDAFTHRMNFSLDGSTGAGMLALFVEGYRMSGDIVVNATLRGTPEHPDLDGTIRAIGLQFLRGEPPIIVSDLDAQLKLTGNRIEIESLGAKVNDGTVQAGGSFGISQNGVDQARITI